MMTESAIKLGHKVVVLDPTPNCPASQVGAEQVIGSLTSAEDIKKLADVSDVLTIEIEHINASALQEIENTKQVIPRPSSILMIQDKFKQKQFLKDHDIAHAESIEITGEERAQGVFDILGSGKVIFKSKSGAYDGRGNQVVSSPDEALEAYSRFAQNGVYAEKIIDFAQEISVMVYVGQNGQTGVYESTTTVHERNICIETHTPAQTDAEVIAKVKDIAIKIATAIDSPGIFGVEMFVTSDGEVLVNEIAPRVHNSGHWTMDGAVTSQFEQLIRIVAGEELGSSEMTVPAITMVNILGTKDSDGQFSVDSKDEQVHIYNYGKTPGKLDRKLGHINAVADTIQIAKQKAYNTREEIDV